MKLWKRLAWCLLPVGFVAFVTAMAWPAMDPAVIPYGLPIFGIFALIGAMGVLGATRPNPVDGGIGHE